MLILRPLLILLALLACCGARAQAPVSAVDSEAPEVSLLTFSPGDIYWERFGHNALLLRDANGRGFVFNYGIFDFRQKNFFLNFARGRMQYRLDVDALGRTERQYAAEGRWIFEQRLNLSPDQRRELAEFLSWNLQPENVEYRYDYFIDNCSTRVRDALDRVMDGSLSRQLSAQPVAHSYRHEVTRLMAPDLALAVGMDLGLGSGVDHPLNLWQQSFIPTTLMEAVRGVRVIGADGTPQPLVKSEGWLYRLDRPEPPAQPPSLLGGFAIAGLLLAAALLVLHNLRDAAAARLAFASLAVLFAAVSGLAGLVLAAGWGLTEHWGMWANQNLLLLNPLMLLLLPCLARSAAVRWAPQRFARRVSALVLLAAALTPLIKLLPFVAAQQNLAWIALLLPAHLALAIALRRPGS